MRFREDITEILPKPLWDIYSQEYKPTQEENVIRVTELIMSPQRRKLYRKYWENISRSVVSVHYKMLGTMIHALLELKEFTEILDKMTEAYKDKDTGALLSYAIQLVEIRKRKKVEYELDGWKIVGTYDLFEDGVLYDYKITSEYIVANKKFDKYEQQLQIYAFMLKNSGHDVKSIKNIFFIRDYSVTRSKLDMPLYVQEYEIWDEEKTKQFIRDRLALHSSEALCTDEDMMLRVKWLVGGREFSSEEKAKAYAAKTKQEVKKLVIPLGCMYFCEVSDYCEQYQKLLSEGYDDSSNQESNSF